jgi:hypothetical protein
MSGRRGTALRVELRTNRTRHADGDCSAEAARCRGLYRYVRNPMYIGFGAEWIGLWGSLRPGQPRRHLGGTSSDDWGIPATRDPSPHLAKSLFSCR